MAKNWTSQPRKTTEATKTMTDSTPDDERFQQAADDLVHVSDAIQEVDYNALLDEDLQRLLEIRAEVREMLRTYRESQPTRAARGDGT